MLKLMFLALSLIQIVSTECTNLNTSNCEFQFQSYQCIFESCVFQNSSGTTNQTSQSVSQVWRECLNLCCYGGNALNIGQTKDELMKRCLYVKQDDQILGIIIGFSIGIPFLILTIYCLYRKWMNRLGSNHTVQIYDQYSQQRTMKQIGNRVDKSQIIQINSSSSQYDRKQSVTYLFEGVLPPEEIPICSICLEKGITIETACGHKFHHLCIVQWINKKKSCPDCRSSELNKFKLWCWKCLRQKTLADFIYLKDGYICKWCKIVS